MLGDDIVCNFEKPSVIFVFRYTVKKNVIKIVRKNSIIRSGYYIKLDRK